MIEVSEETHRREIEMRQRALRVKAIHDRITDPKIGAWGAAEEIEHLQRRIHELENAQ